MASGHVVADFADDNPSLLVCERRSCPSPQLPAGSKRHPVSNPQGTQVRWYCSPCYERTIQLPTTFVACEYPETSPNHAHLLTQPPRPIATRCAQGTVRT
ncbi:hypothetical protein JB92DRAFT_877444 [Gautieria morchelliformis]|nr:hypothetical protein JB92DRAFT_877444 [Gautieria morchelliformis]